jgi:hypothetical protein
MRLTKIVMKDALVWPSPPSSARNGSSPPVLSLDLEQIDEAALQGLEENETPESLRLEFKRELAIATKEQKRATSRATAPWAGAVRVTPSAARAARENRGG